MRKIERVGLHIVVTVLTLRHKYVFIFFFPTKMKHKIFCALWIQNKTTIVFLRRSIILVQILLLLCGEASSHA